MAQRDITVKNNSTNTVVLNNIFDTAQLENIQVLELSNQEMKDTQGAFLPLYGIIYGPPIYQLLHIAGELVPGPQILYNRLESLVTTYSRAFFKGSAISGIYNVDIFEFFPEILALFHRFKDKFTNGKSMLFYPILFTFLIYFYINNFSLIYYFISIFIFCFIIGFLGK